MARQGRVTIEGTDSLGVIDLLPLGFSDLDAALASPP